MFSQREIAQFGVNPRPLFPLAPGTKLVLIREDPRTEEEIERDLLREANDNTIPLFTSPAENGSETPQEQPPIEFPPADIGFRMWQRQGSIQVRRRKGHPTTPERPLSEQQTAQGQAVQEGLDDPGRLHRESLPDQKSHAARLAALRATSGRGNLYALH
jgi:hypothetical protein